ncbi:MFS transporter [Wenjunlia vitaminophila]|uniref:MFS transporter n=1 Tax=Wenjunlia vitaminophila TaxID=76728 RepID=A0A0T6LZ98_WENVI|nr:MFS transporter [Wenjunlia vitaminophila]KRV51428.1 MFS transporter [Wenjunlia vitaminophila]
MLAPYRAIFAAPGARAFSGAGFVAKMPISMLGIGIVTMISQLTGEYGIAGALSATHALSLAVLGPQISRLVDQFGQRRVLRPALLVTVLAVTGLAVCASLGAPTWTWFLCTALAGCTPSMGSMVRARWAHLYGGTPKLHTAYSFESVLDEVCFIIGPIISIGLCTVLFPAAGPVLAITLLTVGVFAITAQRSTEPPPHPKVRAGRGSALRSPGLQVLVGTFAAAGAIFGSVDVITVAFADEQGHKGAASLVLAAYALGSCVAGIVFGLMGPRGRAQRRFLIGVVAMAASMLPLQFVGSLPALGVAVFVAGLAIAPTIVTTMALVERMVPRAQLTEGMTWVSTGLAAGVAAGAAVSGWVVDRSGAQTAFLVSACAGALAVLVASLGLRRLRDVEVSSGETGQKSVPPDAGAPGQDRNAPSPPAPEAERSTAPGTGGAHDEDGHLAAADEPRGLEQLGG